MMRTLIVYFLLIFMATSCQSPQSRAPIKTTSGSFIEASVARNKRIYKQEKAIIQALIKTDSLREYIATESGFWYTLTQKGSTTPTPKACRRRSYYFYLQRERSSWKCYSFS